MEDDRDAEDAIRALDQIQFGRKGRKIRVEWTKEERISRRSESSRKYSSNLRPSKTLFVINFDPYHTRTRDLERHFDPYGKILNVRIKRNYAFIQYESQEDARKALDATNMSQLLGRVISVEYASRDDDERWSVYNTPPSRVHERSPWTRRRDYERARSPSPHRRGRGSHDYGQGHGRTSTQSPMKKERDLEHDGSPGSYCREHERHKSARTSSQSPVKKERDPEHGGPHHRERERHEYGQAASQSPMTKERDRRHGGSPGPYQSPMKKEMDHRHDGSPGPYDKEAERHQDTFRSSQSPTKKETDNELGGSTCPSPTLNLRECERHEYTHRSNQSSPKKEKDLELVPSPSPDQERDPEYNLKHSPAPERGRSPNGSVPSPQTEHGEQMLRGEDNDGCDISHDAGSPPTLPCGSQSPLAQQE